MITIPQFIAKVRKEVGWNAAVGFWAAFYGDLYRRRTLTLEQAIGKLKSYAAYTGTHL